MNPHRVSDEPTTHAWVPAHLGSALDFCVNGCGTRRMTGMFVRGGRPARWFHADPGCDTKGPEVGAMVYSKRTHRFEPIAEVHPKDYAFMDGD